MIKNQEYQSVWTSIERMSFKYIFTYFVLYLLLKSFSSVFEAPVKWFGTWINITYSYDVNGYGSGDNTFAYVSLFMNVALTIVIATIWSLVSRRESYNKLLYWFITILRIYLIGTMFAYGFAKLVQSQFPYPSLLRMLQPIGEQSPIGLAWTYLGYSKGFNLFMGALEVLGGLLLIPKRTSTLGAFVTAGVMAHVVAMNLAYDIPVKLYAIHLTLMALYIFSTDGKRFAHIFIFNRPTATYKFYHPIANKTYHKVILGLKIIGIVYLSWTMVQRNIPYEHSKTHKNKPLLYGVWEVETYIKAQDTIPPLLTDSERWRYLIIEEQEGAYVKTMNDAVIPHMFKTDTLHRKVMIDKSESYNFDYELVDDNTLILEGNLYFYDLKITLKRKDLLLDSRGFHWINERPFNR